MIEERQRPWAKQAAELESIDGAYSDFSGWWKWLAEVDPELFDAVGTMTDNLDVRLYCLMAGIADGDRIKTAAEDAAEVREAIEWARKCREMPTPAGAATS
jgi:hypothetical protein